MKRMTLKTKLLIAFLGCGLLPVFGIGTYFYWESSKNLKQEATARLESIMKLKAKAVENYFKLIENQALTFAHNEGVKSAFRSYQNGFKNFMQENRYSAIDVIAQKQKLAGYYKNEFGKEYEKQNGKGVDVDALMELPNESLALQYAYIANNSHPLGSKHNLDYAGKSGEYNLTHSIHHPNFREFLLKFEFYDIFLIDGETGNIIYTVFKELDYATSLKTGPYKDTGLARVFEKAMALNSEEEMVMEDYSTYRPSYDGPAGFFAAPIWINGVKRGVVAFQISFDKINSITLEKTSNEQTLETFMVGSDYKMRSDSLLDKDNRNVKSSFKYPEKGMMKDDIMKRVIEEGVSIREIHDNYLGNPSVIAAAPLKIMGHKWAITTQLSEDEAFVAVRKMRLAFIIFILGIACIVSIFAVWFANKLASSLLKVTGSLRTEAQTVNESSLVVSDISDKLSEATNQQASSLQETVASINEIAAMISRNADSASTSADASERSTVAAQKGKDKVELMLKSIDEISRGNNEIIEQVQVSNKEISEIVKVIQEISTKTQVINDIVFQTKLLSFNASVEAARAGEHGKGFAVVAEEVGNLASMSGKAATEISDMLEGSVKRVVEIVDKTKSLMDSLVTKSKDRIEFGTNTAKECANALDEILGNVSSVNEMIREIATASQEQSTGVKEVNKAMTELDTVTHKNSESVNSCSEMSGELRRQSERMNELINELAALVNGSDGLKSLDRPVGFKSNVLKMKTTPVRTQTPSMPMKKVSNAEIAPSSEDSRFEDA